MTLRCICTFQDCGGVAVDKIADGIELCADHSDLWQRVLSAARSGGLEHTKRKLAVWVKIQGGPEAAAARMRPAAEAGAKLFDALKRAQSAK
ncbi:hypothetical protein [Achromobacter sp. AGC39]